MLGSQWFVRNLRLSGCTLLKKGDFPYWNEKYYREALTHLPDVVVILLGANDTKSQNWVHIDEFVSNYKDLIASFRNLSSHPIIYICRPCPVFRAGNFGITEANILKEILLVDQIARDENVQEIDLNAPLESKPQFIPDRVHPNKEGSHAIAATVFEALTDDMPPPGS